MIGGWSANIDAVTVADVGAADDVDGILGNDILSQRLVGLDFPRAPIRFVDPSATAARRAEPRSIASPVPVTPTAERLLRAATSASITHLEATTVGGRTKKRPKVYAAVRPADVFRATVARVDGFARAVAIVMTGAVAVTGAYAWSVKRAGAERSAAEGVRLGACQREVEACAAARSDTTKTVSEMAATLDASRAELEGLRTEHAESERRLASFRTLTEKFQKMIDSGRLEILLRHGRMVVKLPAGVLFASGSAELSKEGKDALREVAAVLRQVQNRQFMVAGHTDNVPIDPRAAPPTPFKNNLELSTARALTVAQHLITFGMSPKRIVAAGYGEHEPVKDNAHEAGRQENRRIEIVLLPYVSELPDAGAPPYAGQDARKDAGRDAGR